ncbi:GyrI-like domain-containing protein [Bacillus salitolerans]|uniref:GyrI-like domain-containing protein n=1 Tax=Bacillus salitolerans TaxID=1437434 RepID=A0ABW4LIM3_9BACI
MGNLNQFYVESINKVIDYIEKDLSEKYSLEQLSKIAGISPYHFHRIFKSIQNENLNDFIIRLRLEKSLFLLRRTPINRMVEVALESGFSSSSAYNRSFKKHYGMSPIEYLNNIYDIDMKTGNHVPVITRTPIRKYEIKIQTLSSKPIAYYRVHDSYNEEKWMKGYVELINWAKRKEIINRNTRLIGMSIDDPEVTPLDKCRYDIAITVEEPIESNGFIGAGIFNGGLTAALHYKDTIDNLQEAYDYFFDEWLPRSRYKPRHLPAFEIYHESPPKINFEQLNMDICIPIELIN